MNKFILALTGLFWMATVAQAQHSEHAEGKKDIHGKVGMHTKFEAGLSFNYGEEFGFGPLVGYSFTPEHKVQFTGNLNGKYFSGLYVYEHAIGHGPFYGFLGAGFAFERVEEEVEHHGHKIEEKEWCNVVESKLGLLYHVNHSLGFSASALPNYNITESKFGLMGELEVVFFF
ncbi:MAG: hypothetical protein MI784_16585 [Cytophagales bacterium]|nr:hypothetical protein [Cytophagales bacterium]